jgi:hypothetical protein
MRKKIDRKFVYGALDVIGALKNETLSLLSEKKREKGETKPKHNRTGLKSRGEKPE